MNFKKLLLDAGLLVLEECSELDQLIPAVLTGQAPSCPVEERWAEFVLNVDDPLLYDKSSDGWYQMSLEVGLFSEVDRQFLIAQSQGDDGPSRWIQVKLQDQWDIMGEGAKALLGSAWCRPEFRMLSLDGSVLSCGTTGEVAISVFVLKEPSRSATFRRFAEWIVTTDALHAVDATAVCRWLATVQHSEF